MYNELILINIIFAIIFNHLLPFIRKLVDSSQVKFSWFQVERFVENEKDVNHIVQGLVNMVDGGRRDYPKPNIFCYSDHFVENEKHVNHMGQGLVNMVDGVEQTCLNPISFLYEFC